MSLALSSAWPASKVLRRAVATLKPAERNARTHTDAQIAEIMASIREWGWTQPILIDETDRVIAGHGRLEAAKRLEFEHVPVVVARNWTEAQKRAYLLADNKISLNAGWDDNILRLELHDLRDLGADLSLIGFNADEVTALFAPAAQDTPVNDPPADPGPGAYREQYGVIVLCRDEAHQRDIYERLHADGLEVKVVAT